MGFLSVSASVLTCRSTVNVQLHTGCDICTKYKQTKMAQQLQTLLQACDQVLKQPPPTTDRTAQEFFQQHSLDTVFG